MVDARRRRGSTRSPASTPSAISRRWKSARDLPRPAPPASARASRPADAPQRRAPACAASGSAASRSRRCTAARASPGRPAAASRSSRRGRRPRGACPGSTRAAMTASARSTCCQTVARSAWSSPSGWKNGTASSRIAGVVGGEQVLRPARAAARRRCRRASRRPDVALALEEHEPLRPVAVGVLRPRRRAAAGRAAAPSGRARAASRPAPGRRRACPSRRPSTARARAAPGSGPARCARARAGSPAGRRPPSPTATAAGATRAPAGDAPSRTGSRPRSSSARRARSRRCGRSDAPVMRKLSALGRGGDDRRGTAAGATGRRRTAASSPPDRSMTVPPAASMRKKPSREAPADVGVGHRRAGRRRVPSRVKRDRHGVGAVVAVERDVVREQEATRRAVEHFDRELELVAVARRPAAHLDQAARVLVDPAAAARQPSRRPTARRAGA